MDSETVMPSEISQKKDVKGHTISLAYIGYKTESHRQGKQTKTHGHRQQYSGWRRDRGPEGVEKGTELNIWWRKEI